MPVTFTRAANGSNLVQFAWSRSCGQTGSACPGRAAKHCVAACRAKRKAVFSNKPANLGKVHHPEFQGPILRPGQTYKHHSWHVFIVWPLESGFGAIEARDCLLDSWVNLTHDNSGGRLSFEVLRSDVQQNLANIAILYISFCMQSSCCGQPNRQISVTAFGSSHVAKISLVECRSTLPSRVAFRDKITKTQALSKKMRISMLVKTQYGKCACPLTG